jgi:hypothetical protein
VRLEYVNYHNGKIVRAVYENPRLRSLFEFGKQTTFTNRMELRITKLYQLLNNKGPIYPWMWDWENYSGINTDMIGFFYPEDLAAIRQIKQFENKYIENSRK